MRRSKKFFITIVLFVLMNGTACAREDGRADQSSLTVKAGEEETTWSESETEWETGKTPAATSAAAVDILLMDAPEICLSDALSSTMNSFSVRSGNYEWSYLENGQIVNMVACGSAPLSAEPEPEDKLSVKKYNRMDFASYVVSCIVPPDDLTVREWDVSQLGNPDAKEERTVTYDEAPIIELRPDKVYEITAKWDEGRLKTNGFYGKASYVIVTK